MDARDQLRKSEARLAQLRERLAEIVAGIRLLKDALAGETSTDE